MEEENKPVPEAAAVTTPENPPSTEAQPENPGDSKEYTPIGDVKYYETGISGDEGLEGDDDGADEGANRGSPSAPSGEFAIDPKKAKKAARKEKKKAKAKEKEKEKEPEPEPPAEPEPDPEEADADVNSLTARETPKKSSKAKKKAKKASKAKGSDPDPPAEPTPNTEAVAETPEEPIEPPSPKETGKKDKKNKKKKGKNGKDDSGPAKSRSAASEDAPPPPPPPPPGDEPASPNDNEGTAEQDAPAPPPPPPPSDEPAPPKEEASTDQDTPAPPPPPPSGEPEPPKEEGVADQDNPASPPPPVDDPAPPEVEAATEELAKSTEDVSAEPLAEETSKGEDAEPSPDEPEKSASEEAPEAVTEPSADAPAEEAKDEPAPSPNDSENSTATQGEGTPDASSGGGTEGTSEDKPTDTPAQPDTELTVADEPSTAGATPDDKPAETSADPAETPATEDTAPEPETAALAESPNVVEETASEAEKPSEEVPTSEEVAAMDAGDVNGDESDEKPKDEATPVEGQETGPTGSDGPTFSEVEPPAANGTQGKDSDPSDEKPAEEELVDDPADDSGYAEIADSPTEEKSADSSVPDEAEAKEISTETAPETDGTVDSFEKAPADENAKAPDSEPVDPPKDEPAADDAEPEAAVESSTADKDTTSAKAETELAAEASELVSEEKPGEADPAGTEPEAKEPSDEPATESENSAPAESDEPKVYRASSEQEAVPTADNKPDDTPADTAVSEEPKVEPEAAEPGETNADASETPEAKFEDKTEETAPAYREPPAEPASDDVKDEPASNPPASDAKDEPEAPQIDDADPSSEPSAEHAADTVEESTPEDAEEKGEPEVAESAPPATDENAAPESEAQNDTPPAAPEEGEAETTPKEDPAPADPSKAPQSKDDGDDNKDGSTVEPNIAKPEETTAPAESETKEGPADSEPPKDDASPEPGTSDEPTAAEANDAVDDKPEEDVAPAVENPVLETDNPVDEKPSEDPAVAGEAQDKPSDGARPAKDAPPEESEEVAKGDDESAPVVASDGKQDEDIKPSEDTVPGAAEVSQDDGKPKDELAPEAEDEVVAEKATQTDDDLPPAEDKPTKPAEPAVEPVGESTSVDKADTSAPDASEGPVAEKATQTDPAASTDEDKPAETEKEVSPTEAQTDGAADAELESKPNPPEDVKAEPKGEVEGEMSVDAAPEPAETADKEPTGDDAPAGSNTDATGDKPGEEADSDKPAETTPESEPVPAAENSAEDPPKDEPTADVAAAEAEKGPESDQEPAEADATEETPASEEKEAAEHSPGPAGEVKEEPAGSSEAEVAVEPTEGGKDEPTGPAEAEVTKTSAEEAKDEPAQPEAAVEPVEESKDEPAGEPTGTAEPESAIEAEKPAVSEETNAEPEKPDEEAKATEAPATPEKDTPVENDATVDSGGAKEDLSAENPAEDDKTPEDSPAAEDETVKDEPVVEEKAADPSNAAEAPVEAPAEPPTEPPAETTDDDKNQPVAEENAEAAEVPVEVKDEPAADKESEEPPAPPAGDEPVPEAVKPAEPAPAEDKKDDLAVPAKEDKPADTLEPSAKDAKANEEDEGKDTLGPIPSEEKHVAAKTGENLHTTPATPDFAQDLGESVSRPDDVAVCDVERSEESTALTGEHSHVGRGTVESITGAGGVIPVDGSGPVTLLDPDLEETAGAGVDSFGTPVAEAQDASGERQEDGDGDKIPPADDVAHSTTQIDQATDEDGQAPGEAVSRTDEDDKANEAAATDPGSKADDEPVVQHVEEAEVLEPDETGAADTAGTELSPSQQTEISSLTGKDITAVVDSVTVDEQGGLQTIESLAPAQDSIMAESEADEELSGQASKPSGTAEQEKASRDEDKTTEVFDSGIQIDQIVDEDTQAAVASEQEPEQQPEHRHVEEGTDATGQGETGAHNESITLEAGEDAAAESSGDYSTTQQQPKDEPTEIENPISDTSGDGQPSEGRAPKDTSKLVPPSSTAESTVGNPKAVEASADPIREEGKSEKHSEDLAGSIPVSAGVEIQNSDAVSAADDQHRPADETKDGSIDPAERYEYEAPEVSAENAAATEAQSNHEQLDSPEAKPTGGDLPEGEQAVPFVVPGGGPVSASAELASTPAEDSAHEPITDANADADKTAEEQGQPPAVDSGEKSVVTEDQSAEDSVGENPTSGVPDTAKEPTADVISETKSTSTETERVADDEIATPPGVETDAQHSVSEPHVEEVQVQEDATCSEEPFVAPAGDITDVMGHERVEDNPAIEADALETSSHVEQTATPEVPVQDNSGEDAVSTDAEASTQVVHVDETPAEMAADAPVGEPVEDEVAQPDVSAPIEASTAGDAEAEAVTAGQELSEEKFLQPEASEPDKASRDDTNLDEPSFSVADSGSVPAEKPVEPDAAEDSDKPAVDELSVEPSESAPAEYSDTLALDDATRATEPASDSAAAAAAISENIAAGKVIHESLGVVKGIPASEEPADIPPVAEAAASQSDGASAAPPDATSDAENLPSTLELHVSGAADAVSVSVEESSDSQVAAKGSPNREGEVAAEAIIDEKSVTDTAKIPEPESSLGPAVSDAQKTLLSEDRKTADVNVEEIETTPTKSAKTTQPSEAALTDPIGSSPVKVESVIATPVVPDDDKQDHAVAADAEEVVVESSPSDIPEKEQVVSTDNIQDEVPVSGIEHPHTPPVAASIVDESAKGDNAPVLPVGGASTTSDIGGTSHASSTVDVSQDAAVAREQDEAATSREPVQTDLSPHVSSPKVTAGAFETETPVVQEATPADPGEPVLEAADRSSLDELPVMDDDDDFVLVSPSEVPDKDSIEDVQAIKPVEEGEIFDATIDSGPRFEDQSVATEDPAPIPNETQPAVSRGSDGLSSKSAEATPEFHPDGGDSITQVEPPSKISAASEPATITAGEPTKSVEPSEGDVAANDVVAEDPVGREASESVEPPVEEAGDSQKLAIVEESEVVGSEPRQERAVAVAEDETLPGAENKSAAAETTEELPEPQEPETIATAENTSEKEPVDEDREIFTETPSIPAEVSAPSEETVLVSQPISAPDEGTDLSKDYEPVLVQPPSQREGEPVLIPQQPLEEPAHVVNASSHQPVQPAIPDEAPESSELQPRDPSDFKTHIPIGGPISEAVPVSTGSEKPDLSATTEAVPDAVSDAVMTTGLPKDSGTPAEAARNESLAPQAPYSRGIGETLRADSPVIPGMLPRSTPSQTEAKVDDQAGTPGLDNADTSASDVGNRSVPQKTLDGAPDEGLPEPKDGLAVGAMIGGAVGGGAGLAIAHHASGSDKGKEKNPAEGTVWQDLPQIPTRQGSLSASYKVVYSQGPSGEDDVSRTRRKEKGEAPDSEIEPKNSVHLRARKSHLTPLNLNDQRADTPPIVLPTAADLLPPRPPQRPRQLRRARKMSIARAEEEIAAAVVIYASADALSPPGSPTHEPRPFHFPADDGPSKESASATHLKDSRMDSPTVADLHVGDEDLCQSVADLFTDNDKSSDDKDRDRDRERRRRRRSSHHHHRSSREGESSDSRRHSHSSSHSYRHHRSRADSERSSRTPPDTTPPRTPTRTPRRQDSGYEGEASERSHRRHHRRSPEEHADHEGRRERRLRDKERETERERKESDRDRRDGDRDRRDDRREPRDGERERHRRSRPSTSRSHRDIPTDDSPPKKFLDMDHARGVLAGPRDVPKDAPPPPPSSSRGELPKRSNTTRSKFGRSRRSEDPGGRPHRSRTGDERVRRRSEERLRSDDKMTSEDKLRSEDRLRSDERLRSDDRLPRKGEGEGTRAEEARRRARQEERMRAKEKDDEKRSGFRAAFKKIFS